MVLAYKPTAKYNSKNDTAISKTNLNTGIMLSGQRVGVSDSAIDGTKTLYTVPFGKTLFIISAGIAVMTSNAGNAYISISSDNSSELIITGRASLELAYQHITKQFSIPLKFNSGENIKLVGLDDSGGVVVGAGQINGYLVDTSLLPYFV